MATQVRKAVARHRDLVLWLLSTIRQRPDGKRVLKLLHGVVAGSSVEAIVHLALLAADAVLTRVAPVAVNFRVHPVVDPVTRRMVGDCPVSAYRLNLEGLPCLLIPQVGLACRRYVWRVDFLCAVIGRRRAAHWFVLEIDGEGHDSSADRTRDQDLEIPVLRLTEPEITQGEPLTLLHKRVLPLLNRPRPSK